MSTALPGPPDEPGSPDGDGPAGPAGPADLADLAGPADLVGLAELGDLAELTGDEAVLPAGSRLADEGRAGHQCFFILDGAARVERDGRLLRRLVRGAFVGDLDPGGRPLPAAGVTIRLEARSRVLVLDPARLAAAIDADPVLAAAWRSVIART
jgi:CRP-like cAMP-binding protein